MMLGEHVACQAGWGGKSNQDFKRLSKDTPATVVSLKGYVGGQVIVKFDDDPRHWSFPERGIKTVARDVRPIAMAYDAHKFEPMPGNKPGRPCNKCLERKDHENHFTDSTKTERMKDGISYGEHNPTGKCRECGGPNYGKYAVCAACMRKHPKAHDRSRLHAALDAVLDHGRARDREPSMAEEKAYDMGAADAKKGSAQNPNPDWPSALKSAYVSGYHAGLGHGRARDAGRAPAKYMHEAVDLYHLARTALSGKDDGRWARLNWAAKEMHKAHPEVSATAFYMSLADDWLR